MNRMWSSGWTASSASRSTGRDSRSSHPSPPRAATSRSIATIRSARSGCGPGSWRSEDSWCRKTGADTALYRTGAMPEPSVQRADVAIVGAGAAGLYTALAVVRAGARAALVSATPLAHTASYWAQGGIAAALAADDSPDLHQQDTERAGRLLTRASAARALTTEAREPRRPRVHAVPPDRGGRRPRPRGLPRDRGDPRRGRHPARTRHRRALRRRARTARRGRAGDRPRAAPHRRALGRPRHAPHRSGALPQRGRRAAG